MIAKDSPPFIVWTIRIAGATAVLIGGFWLIAWIAGWAALWSTVAITVKANMAVAQLLSGVALLHEAAIVKRHPHMLGAALGSVVLLIGLLTFSEHLFRLDFGIDQLLAHEFPGAPGTASPNRIGPPGSASLMILGGGLLSLALGRQAFAQRLGLAVCLIAIFPAVGFLYGIEVFYSQPHLTGIAWPTVIALVSLGAGLVLSRTKDGPIALFLREDAGGALMRRMLPAVILIPLLLGFFGVIGQLHGLYDTPTGTGLLVIIMILIFASFLWDSAARVSRETSARHAAEEALRGSEKRYRNLFENMSEGFALHEILTDQHGQPCDYRFLDINASFERLTGLKAKETIGKQVSEVLPGVEPAWIERYGRVALTGEPTHFESYSASLGRWYEVLAYRPGPLQFAAIFTDITQRKQTEQALQESEARFRLAIEHSELMAWQCNAEMQFTWVYNSHFGIPDHELLGRTPNELQMDDGMAEFVVHAREVLARGSRTRKTIKYTHHDRREQYFDQQVETVRDGQGCIIGLIGISLDVTERILAEQRLHRSEESFRLMVGHASEPMLLVEESGRIECASRKGAEQLGYQETELVGRHVQDFLNWTGGKLDLALRLQDFQRHAPLPGRAVLRIKRNGGSECWLDVQASFVNYGQRPEKYLLKFEVIGKDPAK